MQVLTRFDAYRPGKNRPLILTLGTFDGVHEGHLRVLRKVIHRAREIGGTAGILTFSVHPMHVLAHEEPPYLITSTPHRLRLLDQMGFDLAFLIRFTKKFSRQSPEEFVKNIFVDKLHLKEMVLGYDSRFGKNRQGTVKDMFRFARKYGFRLFSVKPRLFRNLPVSSTKIRTLILKGDFAKVRKCLGRPYSILGNVVRGRGFGKKLGFPTANLNPHSEALPPKGVYLVSLDIVDIGLERDPKRYCYRLNDRIVRKGLIGLLNIGSRPTIQKILRRKSGRIVPEIHILNFKGDLYGKILEVTFKKKIRDEFKFNTVEELKKQIKKDIRTADKYKVCEMSKV